MNYIVTITDRSYIQYTHRFIYELHGIGYRGEIIVLTTDANIYCNAKVVKLDKMFESKVDSLNDSRWLQFDLLKPDLFKDGDKIIYLDSDVVVLPAFNYNEMFQKYTFATSILYHDDVQEYQLLNKILNRENNISSVKAKYIASPFVFEINQKARKFFDLCKIMQQISNQYRRGTLFAFNLACYSCGFEIEIIPKELCVYTKDIKDKTVPKNPILIHYGGGDGKELWKADYQDNKNYTGDDKPCKPYEYTSETRNGDRYAFQTTEGLGNQIETCFTYMALIEKYKNVDVIFSFSDRDNANNTRFYEILTDYYGNRCYSARDGILPIAIRKQFKGLLTCRKVKVLDIPIIAENPIYSHGSEVDRDIDILKKVFTYSDDNIKEMFKILLPLNWKKIRGKKYNDFPEYDIIICNGSKHNLKWIKKRYLRMNEVVDELKDKYKIACVGHPDEYIHGTDDYTHLTLEETFDFCNNAKAHIVMDSGLFHFLCAIGKEPIVIFGGTNWVKNTHIKLSPDGLWGFHHKAIIVRHSECDYQPCQREWVLSDEWDKCRFYQCMMFNPEIIIKFVLEKLIDKEFQALEGND